MKFGLNLFPSFRPSDSTTARYYDQCLRLAERADRVGYHSIKTVEHSFYDYGGHSPNPCVFLSAIAARTQRIRLVTGAVIPAFHHPAHLGGDLAMLDNMSNGRLDAGFGRAFLPKEFEVYGVSMEESRSRFEEGISMIKRLWTEESVTQIAAISSEESFVYAARNAFNVMIVPYAGKPGQLQEFVKQYRRVWAESGHGAGKEKVQVAQFCCVAETREKARAGYERIMTRYLETFGDAVTSWQGKRSDQYPGYDKMVASILATTPNDIIENNAAFVGTPDEVIDQVHRCVEVFGPIEPSMQMNFGGTTDEHAFRTLNLFADNVMPAFS